MVDFDVSNATSDSEDIAYAFGIDHVDGSGDVLHYGGGAHCSLSWLTVGGGYATSGSFQSLGAVGRTLAATFAPTGSGVARFCRITLNATDWQGLTVSASVRIQVGGSSGTAGSLTVVDHATADAVPLVFVRAGTTQAGVVLFIPDKCDGKTCPAEDQCQHASVCDHGTGECLAQVPKTGASCDDGDDTTQGETCTSQGICVGTSKCLGVVCEPLSTCHDAGSCVPNTGVCSPSTLKPAGSYCDDEDPTTVFDICDAAGNCQGTDVETLVRDEEMDFTTVAGVDPMRLRSFLSTLPDVCCDTDVCCKPCQTSGCVEGEYDHLWYLQTTDA